MRGLVLWVLPTLLIAGCSEAISEDVTLEVLTWWESGSEGDALETLTDPFEEQNPEIRVDPKTRDSADDTRSNLGVRMLSGHPPASFQANAGADLLRWLDVAYVPGDQGSIIASPEHRVRLLSAVTRSLHETGALDEARGMYPEVLEHVRVGRDYYGVPVNVHRLNLVYYNQVVVAEYADQHEGASLLDLEVLCPTTPQPALGSNVIAIGADAFELVLLTFENLLPALAGAAFYDDFFRGRLSGEDSGEVWEPKVEQVLRCVRRLWESARVEVSWEDAAKRVAEGRAAFTVMGDWATAEIATVKFDQVGRAPFPGTDEIFVFTADTFPLPTGTAHPEQVRQLLTFFSNPRRQVEFSVVKGSIPAFRGSSVSDPSLWSDEVLEVWALESQRAFASDDVQKVLATSGRLPSAFPMAELGQRLQDLVKASVDAVESRIREVIELLRSSLPLLEQWQARLKQLSETSR